MGFGVSGFGFRVSGFGFRVSGFEFRVSGFRLRVSGFGFRDSDGGGGPPHSPVHPAVQRTWHIQGQILALAFRQKSLNPLKLFPLRSAAGDSGGGGLLPPPPGLPGRVSGFRFRVPGFGSRASDFGFRVPDSGFRVLGFGFRVSGFGLRKVMADLLPLRPPRRPANMAHTRQSRPDPGLGFQAKVPKPFSTCSLFARKRGIRGGGTSCPPGLPGRVTGSGYEVSGSGFRVSGFVFQRPPRTLQ